MEKNIIGEWGAQLNEAEYAKALAALGVLESTGLQQYPPTDDPQDLLYILRAEFEGGERTVSWRGAFNPQATDSSSWHETIHQNPAALARVWQLMIDHYAFQPRNRPRLAVKSAWRDRADLFDLESLLGWLAKPEVGCQALNLVPENMSEDDCRYLWHWPVQIGIPTGEAGRALMEMLRVPDHRWVEELALLHWIGEARDSCDLLILPAGMAAQLAEEPRLRLRASFIICLDDPVKIGQIPDAPAAQLLKRTGAAGVALVGDIPKENVHSWYRETIRELSHDLPIHAAVWGVGIYRVGIPPMILGLPRLLDRLRILAIAERVDRKLDLMLKSGNFDFLESFGKQSEADYVREVPFTSEEEYGMPAATRFLQVEQNLDHASPPRWIQADIRHDQVGAQPAKAFAPSQPSLVSIYIGPSVKKRMDTAFPDQEINFRDGPVQVDLQIELTGAAAAALPPQHRYQHYIQNQYPLAQFFQALSHIIPAPEPASVGSPLRSLASQSISLPAAGNSEQAEFVVWPQPGVSAVTGRIAVIHQNRIIQTALLTAPVGVETEVKTGVVVEAEQIVHPRLDDLDERRGGDAAIILADDQGGPLRLTISRNGVPEDVPLDSVQSVITDIRNVVLGATRRAADTLDLTTSKEMRDLLFALSYHGSLLYQFLQNRLGNWLDDMERIQILTYGNKYFPLEYVYCGPSADLNAEVCPNALQALKDGVCKSCETKGSPDRICPLFFWGFSKVIERHANQPARSARGDELKRMPTPTRTPFGVVTPAILAASDKAFDFTDGETVQKNLLDLISRLGAGQPASVAHDWPGWRKLIETGPKLLILLVHSDTIGANIELLEIGKGDKLLKTAILPDVVGAVETPQLLLLLGCATAQVNIDFAPYPEKFHDAGADIIIAPLAPILGADAAPIACRISELLGEWMAKEREITFGDLLKQIRCDLLAQGHPGVLGLVSFGDADWIFGS